MTLPRRQANSSRHNSGLDVQGRTTTSKTGWLGPGNEEVSDNAGYPFRHKRLMSGTKSMLGLRQNNSMATAKDVQYNITQYNETESNRKQHNGHGYRTCWHACGDTQCWLSWKHRQGLTGLDLRL